MCGTKDDATGDRISLAAKRETSWLRRAAVVAAAALIAITAVDLRPAAAGERAPGVQTGAGAQVTDISARKRKRHYSRRGHAAGMAMFGATLGAIGAIAASQARRRHYESYYRPYYGYDYGYAYGPRDYHGPRYYRGRGYYAGPGFRHGGVNPYRPRYWHRAYREQFGR